MCELFCLLCDSSRMVVVSVLVIVVVELWICWRIVADEVTCFNSYSQCFYRVTLTVAALLWILYFYCELLNGNSVMLIMCYVRVN